MDQGGSVTLDIGHWTLDVGLSISRQLRRQVLIDRRASGPVSYFPHKHVNSTRNLLHFLIINFVCRVRRPVIVFVLAIEEEDDRDTLSGVVKVVAAEEEAIGIVWI